LTTLIRIWFSGIEGSLALSPISILPQGRVAELQMRRHHYTWKARSVDIDVLMCRSNEFEYAAEFSPGWVLVSVRRLV